MLVFSAVFSLVATLPEHAILTPLLPSPPFISLRCLVCVCSCQWPWAITMATGNQRTNDAGPNNDDNATHVDIEDSVVQKLAESDATFAALSSDAKAATDAEHAMTIRQAFKLYPKAVAWSMFFSTAVAMEGYDLVLISAFYAYPSFTKKYGVPAKNGKGYQIPAPWQAGLSNGARVGEILGLLVNGIICERFGFKKTMIGTLCLLSALIFIPFFAPNIETLQVAEILMGVPWGVFQTLTTAYAAEVCPVALRGYLTT